jgi:hypothetical protein
LALSGGGTAKLDVNPRIDLRQYGLGTYTVAKVTFDATCRFSVSGQSLNASAAGDLEFDVPGFDAHLGPYHLACDLMQAENALANLAGLFEAAAHDVAKIASDLFAELKKDATKFTALVNSGVIALDDSLDHVLQKVFNVNLADVTATSTCFATTAMAPRLRATALAAPAPAAAADPLDLLRQMRTDLGGSPMGRWLLNIYNTISEPMVHLYDYQPADPNTATLKQALDADQAESVYDALLQLLKAAGSGQPVTVSQDTVSNGEAIVTDVWDLAHAYAAAGPDQQREGTLIQLGINALLNQLPAIADMAKAGLTYTQIKEKIAQMPAPANPFPPSS